MTHSFQCPSAETLALIPNGLARGRLRQALLVHVDLCARCRTVLAYAGQYEASREDASPSHNEAATAFRLGVQLAVLCAALEDGRRKDAAAARRALRSLIGSGLFSARWSRLEEDPPKCLAREDFFVPGLKQELAQRLDHAAFTLGQWAEASRLAAASCNWRYFARPAFQQLLARLHGQQFSPTVEMVLREIREASSTSAGPSLKRLERAFRRLILVF